MPAHRDPRGPFDEPSTAAERLEAEHGPLDLILIECGGDNLAATFSPRAGRLLDLRDRRRPPATTSRASAGSGILQADLLVVNKIDLAPHVGADLERMRADVAAVRPGRPSLFTNLRAPDGAREVFEELCRSALFRDLTPR